MVKLNRCNKVAARSVLVTLFAVTGWASNPGAFATEAQTAGASVPGPASAAKSATPAKPLDSHTRQMLERIHTAMIEAEQRRVEAGRPDPAVPPELAEQWGVRVLSVTYTADGFWLDFRFRVIDPDKAAPLFDSRFKPYIESEQSGAKFAVPSAAKVGSLRTTNRGHNIKAGKIYTIMFANPGFHLKPGQKATVGIGDFKVEHLTVRGQLSQKIGQAE